MFRGLIVMNPSMSKLFFLLSGEHPSLPFSEVLAVLEAENVKFKVVQKLPQVLRLEAEPEACRAICSRASMTFLCCEELICCPADYDDIFASCRDVDWSFIRGRRYAVRVKRVMRSSPHISTRFLERELGAIIYTSLRGEAKVDLTCPELLLQGVLTDNSFIFGLVLGRVNRSDFNVRRPKFRPFFHPSSLDAIISRLFVNLCRAKRGGVFLDPFCGAGGFLIEAGLIGCRVVGMDIDPKMTSGAKVNMRFFGVEPISIILGDAKHLPLHKVDCIATDPPYGRSASTRGARLEFLLREFLCEAYSVLKSGGYLCIAAPSKLMLEDLGRDAGFKVVESHRMRVHRSLTRVIAVFKRS
ncbi:MAG: TIGR01177 family methyltransferase [Candidatus Methanomethylicota archaeon]|uniref:tRNA (guanine(10)-N(2))-dimethyltransferase n=1 Tax=Thermoproteota archaeon TaxID=2056631 RepID=A0A497EWP9_9CREN|nr:MAG: TIGR01177 family methyltransferase [Candidatus Verstraetearchaeota archaeon]